jgi:hypothetical protein
MVLFIALGGLFMDMTLFMVCDGIVHGNDIILFMGMSWYCSWA